MAPLRPIGIQVSQQNRILMEFKDQEWKVNEIHPFTLIDFNISPKSWSIYFGPLIGDYLTLQGKDSKSIAVEIPMIV